MNNTLYLIGNGFDLHHGLPTAYKHFRENYARKHEINIWRKLRELYGDKINEDLWWSDFENMLGLIDYTNLLSSTNGVALGFVKVQQFLKNTLPPLFGAWIKGIDDNIMTDSIIKVPEIDTTALYITFNYTTLLEKIYNVPKEKIWYIHNSVNDYKNGTDPIVGHDIDCKTLMDYSSTYTRQGVPANIIDTINRELQHGAKKVKDRIIANNERFYNYANVNHIIAMGFSFNDIDIPYIKSIIKANTDSRNLQWTIYWHSEGEDTRFKQRLQSLGIPNDHIEMFKW